MEICINSTRASRRVAANSLPSSIRLAHWSPPHPEDIVESDWGHIRVATSWRGRRRGRRRRRRVLMTSCRRCSGAVVTAPLTSPILPRYSLLLLVLW